LNAYLSSSVECFGSLLLIIGFASRLTAILVADTMALAYLTTDLDASPFCDDAERPVRQFVFEIVT
jgi:uncharacterized membrane protein YphA (DoxX/SURF4 family)